MKKTLTVLLVLAVAMGGLFATVKDSKTLLLTTGVTPNTIVGFSTVTIADYDTTPTAASASYVVSAFPTAVYVYYKSNEKASYTVSLVSTCFISDANSTVKAAYKINVNNSDVSVPQGTGTTALLATPVSVTVGTEAVGATIATLKTPVIDSKALAASDYTATITVKIETA